MFLFAVRTPCACAPAVVVRFGRDVPSAAAFAHFDPALIFRSKCGKVYGNFLDRKDGVLIEIVVQYAGQLLRNVIEVDCRDAVAVTAHETYGRIVPLRLGNYNGDVFSAVESGHFDLPAAVATYSVDQCDEFFFGIYLSVPL